MVVLNLADLKKSEIKYEISKYPDGQVNIELTHHLSDKPTQIISRMNNMEDLGLIICAVACLRRLGVKEIHLYSPYLVGARSDRQFKTIGGNSYLVDVVAPIINSLNFDSVTVLDVHSEVAAACIKNLIAETNLKLVNWAIQDLIWKQGEVRGKTPRDSYYDKMMLISPDANATKKIDKVAEAINFKGEIITCVKRRDDEGEPYVQVPEFDTSKDVIIIDDIFDFGGTFKSIGGSLNDAGHIGKKYLIVTHAIQDAGIEDAFKWFDCIYTTNSYKERPSSEKLQILKVI